MTRQMPYEPLRAFILFGLFDVVGSMVKGLLLGFANTLHSCLSILQ